MAAVAVALQHDLTNIQFSIPNSHSNAELLMPSQDLRLLVLLTDAFGGHGGIAKFNRDLLNAVCSYPKPTEVVALPRIIEHRAERLPLNLKYVTEAANSKAGYAIQALKAIGINPQLIICGHINLL